MKRIACALLALVMLCGLTGAMAEDIQFAGRSLDELYSLRERLNQAIDALEDAENIRVYDSGSYLVGDEMPAGDYVLIENEDAMFANVIVREASGDSTGMLSYDIINGQCVIRLSENTQVQLSQARAWPIAQAPRQEGDFVPEGSYLVGTLLRPGLYEIVPAKGAPLPSYSIYDGILGTDAQLIQFETVRQNKAIELFDGNYIELSGCGLATINQHEAMEESAP